MESDRYNYRVFWWPEDESYVAQCGELPSISGIGSSPEKALSEARTAAAAAVEWMREEGEAVPAPTIEKEYKGKVLLRLSPETHRLISMRAVEEGRSVNQYLNSLIEKNLYADTIENSTSRLEQILEKIEVLQEKENSVR
jgi:predicted HicB family RNase H-like nuclease